MQLVNEVRSSVSVASRLVLTAPFDPAVADRLLDLLSSDDAYRALFEREPRVALAQIGHVLADGEDCTFGIQLASKAVIAGAREEVKAMLLVGLNQTVPRLDSGLETRRRLRQ